MDHHTVALYAFVGYSPGVGGGSYHLRIDEVNAEVTVDPPDRDWQWIGGELSTPKEVTKGKTYTFVLYHSDSVNYYYDPTNPYEY